MCSGSSETFLLIVKCQTAPQNCSQSHFFTSPERCQKNDMLSDAKYPPNPVFCGPWKSCEHTHNSHHKNSCSFFFVGNRHLTPIICQTPTKKGNLQRPTCHKCRPQSATVLRTHEPGQLLVLSIPVVLVRAYFGSCLACLPARSAFGRGSAPRCLHQGAPSAFHRTFMSRFFT